MALGETVAKLFFVEKPAAQMNESGLREPRFWPVFCAFFLLLLVFNIQHLFDPPYWDGPMGVYRQATWLYHNDFNFVRLNQLARYPTGPNINVTLGYAPLYAWLLGHLSVANSLFVMHIFTLIQAALCATLTLKLLSRYLPPVHCLSWTLAAIFQPMWSGQAAGIYLEIPVATVIVTCFYLVQRKYWGLAAFVCIVGYHAKGTVYLVALAFVVFSIFRFLVYKLVGKSWSEYFNKRQLYLFVPLAVFKLLWSAPKSKLVFAFVSRFRLFLSYFPDLLLLLIVALVLVAVTLLLSRTRSQFLSSINEFDDLSLWTTFTLGFAIAFFIHYIPVLRYFIALTLPVACICAVLLSRVISRKASLIVAGLWLCINLVNLNGALLPAIPMDESRSGGWLERSREYLDDLRDQQQFFRAIEAKYSDKPIVVRLPVADILARPELGYVSKGFTNLQQVDPIVQYRGFKVLSPKVWNSKEVYVIWVANSFEKDRAKNARGRFLLMGLSPQPEDEILIKQETKGLAPLLFYRKRR